MAWCDTIWYIAVWYDMICHVRLCDITVLCTLRRGGRVTRRVALREGADCVWHLGAAVGPFHPWQLYQDKGRPAPPAADAGMVAVLLAASTWLRPWL